MNDREKALEILKEGKILLYPSDTVWGIGCDARNENAVEAVARLKKRPDSKSYIILLDAPEKMEQYAREVPSIAYDLVEFAEHPLTLVLDAGRNVAPQVLAADGSIGIRIVKSGFCFELIRKFRGPLLSTSANLSGEATPTTFRAISEEIKSGVDFCVPEQEARFLSSKPSSIMKLGADGTFTFIRR